MAPAVVLAGADEGLLNTISLHKSTSNNSMELFAQKECYIFRLRNDTKHGQTDACNFGRNCNSSNLYFEHGDAYA